MVDKQGLQNITEASAAKWKRLHELEAENARLKAVVDAAVAWYWQENNPTTDALINAVAILLAQEGE